MPSKPHVPNFSPLGFMGLAHESCLERFLTFIASICLGFVRTRFGTTQSDTGFARKKAQTISFIERGFERLGLDHKSVVFRGVHT